MFGGNKKRVLALEQKLREESKVLEVNLLAKISELDKELAKESRRLVDGMSTISQHCKQCNSRYEEKLADVETQLGAAVERINALMSRVESDNTRSTAYCERADSDIMQIKCTMEDMFRRQNESETEVEATFRQVKGAVVDLQEKANKISEALSGDFYNLSAYRYEKDKDSLRHNGHSVEWIVKNVSKRLEECPEGHAVTSPAFSANLPQVGQVSDLTLAFFPHGERKGAHGCSLYLQHPIDAPWMRFNLTVGSQKRGPFDTIYKGPPLFCELGPEINEGLPQEWDAVRLSVEFLVPKEGADGPLGEDREDVLQQNEHLYSTSELLPKTEGINRFFPFEKMMEIMDSGIPPQYRVPLKSKESLGY